MSIPLIVTLSVLGALLLVIITLLFTANFILYKSTNNKQLKKQISSWEEPTEGFLSQQDSDWFFDKNNFRKITIVACDKKNISAYFHETQSHLYIVYAHGYGGNPNEKTKVLHELNKHYGCNVLILEQRGQNDSKIKYLTMGIKEGSDLSLWCSYLVNIDSNAKIIIYGQSMGAATVMSAPLYGLNKNVIGAIEDCGYIDLINQFSFSGKGYAPKPLLKIVSFLMCVCYLFHGANPFKYSPKKGLEKMSIPLLAIHGEKDQVVEYRNFIEIDKFINKNISITKHSFPTAEHAMSVYVDSDRYMNALFTFIDTNNK